MWSEGDFFWVGARDVCLLLYIGYKLCPYAGVRGAWIMGQPSPWCFLQPCLLKKLEYVALTFFEEVKYKSVDDRNDPPLCAIL